MIDSFAVAVFRVRVTSADIPGALSRMEQRGMEFSDIIWIDPLTVELRVCKKFMAPVREFCEKNGLSLQIIEESGWLKMAKKLLSRPVLILGILLLLGLTVFVPQYVFFVTVEGNHTVPSDLILEQLANCNVGFGTRGDAIRSEDVKNHLLVSIPSVQWVGIEVRGCVAVVIVQERAVEHRDPAQPPVSSVVASRDGVIQSVTVLAGNPVCRVGDVVKAGDVLISGIVDCGILIRAGAARGEVFAETSRNFSAVSPVEYIERGDCIRTDKKISLIIGKKRINFQNSSGISGAECVRIYLEKCVTLPGGYRLPFGIGVEEVRYYQMRMIPCEDPGPALTAFAERYVGSQMIGGSVQSAAHTFTDQGQFYRIDSVFACVEMIGIIQEEELLPDYENRGTDRKCRAG